MYDTPLANGPQPEVAQTRALFESLLTDLEPALTPFEPKADAPSRRGRPRRLCQTHLWLGWVRCSLQGMNSYAEVWRLLGTRSVGRFASGRLTCQAVVWRLQRAGAQPMVALNARLNDLVHERLPLPSACSLAPFAHTILAFDETTLDAVHKHLPA